MKSKRTGLPIKPKALNNARDDKLTTPFWRNALVQAHGRARLERVVRVRSRRQVGTGNDWMRSSVPPHAEENVMSYPGKEDRLLDDPEDFEPKVDENGEVIEEPDDEADENEDD